MNHGTKYAGSLGKFYQYPRGVGANLLGESMQY